MWNRFICLLQALIHGLNRHYYSIAINYRKNELEQKVIIAHQPSVISVYFVPIYFVPVYFVPVCFVPVYFVPVYFVPICFVPVCFVPVCFVPVCFVPVCFVPVYFVSVYFLPVYFLPVYFLPVYFVPVYFVNSSLSFVNSSPSISTASFLYSVNLHLFRTSCLFRPVSTSAARAFRPQMLLNLHKKSWIDGLTLKDYKTHGEANERTVKGMLELAKNYNKVRTPPERPHPHPLMAHLLPLPDAPTATQCPQGQPPTPTPIGW